MNGGLNIKGERILLRAVEPADIDFIYSIENDINNWGLSGTKLPFSRYILERFVEAQALDFVESKQQRLMIVLLTGEVIGTLDLFEYDPYNHRAGVGILIIAEYRAQGYGKEVLRLLEIYGREILQLHQLWCGVEAQNTASLRLFSSCGYKQIGIKKDWLWRLGTYEDEILMQLIL